MSAYTKEQIKSHLERERERERDRQTDRQTDRKTDREADRERTQVSFFKSEKGIFHLGCHYHKMIFDEFACQ